MKRLLIFIVVLSCFFSVFSWASEMKAYNTGPTPHEAAYVAGELLIKYKPSVRASALEHYRSQLGVTTLRSFRSIGVQHVKLPKDMTVEEALDIFRDDPNVEYAEPNYLRYEAETPNDTFFPSLWGLHNTGQPVDEITGTADADIDAPDAWDITKGSSNVVVAVIDSGVDYNHQDLAANIWSNAGDPTVDGSDDDGNGYEDDVRGWDFVDDDNNPIDSRDHGTHVAGIIAAKGNNGTGITGVCWTATIMPLRALDAFGSGSVADEVAAIDYAIDKGANIINLSLGGYSFSTTENNAISRARTAGILVVAAAGNSGVDTDTNPHYPSSYDQDNIISVAATDQDDNLASFSNYGVTSVDVAAPGTNIHSTIPNRQTVWSDNFDDGDISDWATGGDKNTWGVTSEYKRSVSYSLTDYPNNDYEASTNSYAQKVIDLSSTAGSKLAFWWMGSSQSGDYFSVQSSTDGTSWTTLYLKIGSQTGQLWYGNVSSFIKVEADLGSYDGSSTFYLRFRFQSNSDGNLGEGWFVDDVEITAADTNYTDPQDQYYDYFEGTSMAAPFVSGLAALIKANNPSLTYTEIKALVENSVESKSSLNGKVATGGRINAAQALVKEEYTLTMNTVGQGQVTLDPAGGTYAAGTEVTLTAEPVSGWEFSGWSGDLTGSQNPVTITMDSDKNVTATFVEGDYTLTVNTVGQGSVTLDPPGGVYDEGTLVTLTATADRYWEFSGWSGDLTGSANPKSISMDTNKNITATFVGEPPDFAYLWEDFEGAFVTASDYGSIPSGWVAKGPDEVVEFSKGTEEHHGESGFHANVTYHPTNYSYIERVFSGEPDTTLDLRVKVKGSTEGRASVRLATVGKSVTKYWYRTTPGDWKTLTLEDVQVPPDGQLLVGLMVAHEEGAGSTDYDIDCLSSTAPLEGGPYDLTVTTEGQGSVTLDPPGGSYAGGRVVTLTATADPGWGFSGWSGDLTGSNNPVTITMDSDKTVTATFVEGPFTLTVTPVGQGSVTLDPSGGTYDAGTVVKLTANEVGDWMFCGWSGDLTGVANPETITMNSNKSVTATFIEVVAGDPDSTINDVSAYDPNNTAAEGRPADLPYGMMEVEIGVLNPGDIGVVTVNLPSAAPADYDWYKYTVADGWINFMRNEISAGTGDGAEFNPARTQLTLYITDNGPYDDDPTPGIIRDPSGLGSTAASPPPPQSGGGGGGGGGCFIATAAFGSPSLALMALLLVVMSACVVVLVRSIRARGRMA